MIGCDQAACKQALEEAAAAGKTPAVIVLAGSFNPVHQGHVRCVEEARKFLDGKPEYNYAIIGALLSPASESRVVRKFKKLGKGDPMRLETRVRACAAAASRVPWLGVLSMEAAGIAAGCSDSTEAVVRAAQFLAGGATVTAIQITTSESVDTYGGWDGCVKWESEQPGRVFPHRVVMNRAGSSMPEGEPPPGWDVVPPPPAEEELVISSTKVREFIQNGAWDELAKPDMLGEEEAALLKARHEAGEMYMPAE